MEQSHALPDTYSLTQCLKSTFIPTMITPVKIPLAFENMEEATIGAWQVREGDMVAEGGALCELITEKTTFDLPSPVAGTLRRIVLPAKSVAAVGEIICLIGDAHEALPDLESLQDASAAPNPQSTFAAAPDKSTFTPAKNTRLRATPAARRAAREAGIHLEDVAAAFPGKVVSEEDVKRFKGSV